MPAEAGCKARKKWVTFRGCKAEETDGRCNLRSVQAEFFPQLLTWRLSLTSRHTLKAVATMVFAPLGAGVQLSSCSVVKKSSTPFHSLHLHRLQCTMKNPSPTKLTMTQRHIVPTNAHARGEHSSPSSPKKKRPPNSKHDMMPSMTKRERRANVPYPSLYATTP